MSEPQIVHGRHGGTTPVRCRGCRQPWPCPEAQAQMLPMKPYTRYVCPNDGSDGRYHGSHYTGARNPAVSSLSDGYCVMCGAVQVPEDELHTETYRLTWESVGLAHLRLYSNADPALYSNTTQVVPNSEIPDEHWHEVSKQDINPWQQYRTLKAWADADTGFVRNVRLERMVSEPTWVPVEATP